MPPPRQSIPAIAALPRESRSAAESGRRSHRGAGRAGPAHLTQLAAVVNRSSTPAVAAVKAGTSQVIQCGGSSVRHLNTPGQLSTTYADGFDRDIIDDPEAWMELTEDFDAAADAMGLSDAVLGADRRYERAFTIRSARFEYSAYWDRRTLRLVVQSSRFIGAGPMPHFMLPSARLRQMVAFKTGVRREDLPVIDFLSAHMRWDLDTLNVTTSSDDVITFIPAGVPVVVQYYRSQESFDAAAAALARLPAAGVPGVARTRVISRPMRLLGVQKVMPLNSLSNQRPAAAAAGLGAAAAAAASSGDVARAPARSPRQEFVQANAQQIFIETRAAILAMAHHGVSQGDVSIDNLGRSDGHFVLFDFNLARGSDDRSIERDLQSLIRSLAHHGVEVPEEYRKDPRARGPWG